MSYPLLPALCAVIAAQLACGRPQQTATDRPTSVSGEPTSVPAEATTSAAEEEQLSTGFIEYGGLPRSYMIRIPRDTGGEAPLPLVVGLHGGGGRGEQICTLEGGLPDLADREGLLLLCPDAVEEHWNDGRQIRRYRAHREGIDDVGFVLALIERIHQEYVVDDRLIYIHGASNGGMMTYRMACQAPATFAAAASVIANLPVDLSCDPSAPIPILIMNGTEDPLMPYEGGQVQFGPTKMGGVYSTSETVAFWVDANRCQPIPEVTYLEEQAPLDGTRVRKEAYGPCAQGAEVVLYEVIGGGHTWPGGPQYAPRAVIGPVSREGHMGEILWEFFGRHQR